MAPGVSAAVILEDQRYYIQHTRVVLNSRLTKELQGFEDEFVPTTAIFWDKASFDDNDLKKVCEEYGSCDDVWKPLFLSLIVLLQPNSLKTAVDVEPLCLQIDNSSALLPKGPLVISKSTGRICKVAKLVADTHSAFISATIPCRRPTAAFEEFPTQSRIEIALPSRLYFQKTETQPLAGIRVAVKDTIALKGLRTGYGNKAWADMQRPEKHTAPCVQQLLDAGAVVVGKTKTSEFAEGIDPADWAEGVCPFNPRGDGQQKPSSSSTGSASATAAYEWLDIAYGTDTGGSIRHPAGVQGLFGQRPTHGVIDMDGVLGATPLFNTVGIFARNAKLFSQVGGMLVDLGNTPKLDCTQRKYNLLYPTRAPNVDNRDPFHGNQLRWFPHPEVAHASYSVAEKQIEAVISRIEAELNCQRVPFNLDELWRATHPIEHSRSIDEATGFIYGVMTTASTWQTDIDQFIKKFANANNGSDPQISALVRNRFEYGRQCSKQKIEAALKATNAFSRWVLNDLFGSLDQDATTLLIFPQSWGRPDYRNDTVKGAPLFKEAFSIYSFAYLCGCPDYTIPVGEVPYMSQVSQEVEYLPTSISLVGRPGTDLELFSVVDHLYDKGIISDVMAGKRMYPETSGRPSERS